MITLNTSDQRPVRALAQWLTSEPRDCDECGHPATDPHLHPVKLAPGVFLNYIICDSCRDHYAEHSAVCKDDSARGIVRTYTMPRIAKDYQKIADRITVVTQ